MLFISSRPQCVNRHTQATRFMAVSHSRSQELWHVFPCHHYSDVMMRAMTSQITGVSIFALLLVQAEINETSKLRVIDLCEGNSLLPGELPAQIATNAENVSI